MRRRRRLTKELKLNKIKSIKPRKTSQRKTSQRKTSHPIRRLTRNSKTKKTIKLTLPNQRV